MQPYFERDGITIYHGDCREILPSLKSESVDLLLTDPPYGVRWRSGHRKGNRFDGIVGDDGSHDVMDTIGLAAAKLRHGCHLYIFDAPMNATATLDFARLNVSGVTELIWNKGKTGLGNLASPWGISHERIWFAVKCRPHEKNTGAGAIAARQRRGSVLSYPKLNGAAVARHPTEKPVMLMRELIEMSTRFGQIVLDPFMGSGSTLVAAMQEGRRAIGIEIEERYCEIAAKRLQQAALPLPAF